VCKNLNGSVKYGHLVTEFMTDNSWLNFCFSTVWWTIVFGTLLTSSLAVLQVLTDIRGDRIGEDNKLTTIYWKWIDVIFREIPYVNIWYRYVYDTSLHWWQVYLSRQTSTVNSIQLLPCPAWLNHPDGVRTPLHSLDQVWSQESRLMYRPSLTRKERAWVFTPSEDYLIQYSIKDSTLPHPFIVYYPKGTRAIFPPVPLKTYWTPPSRSPISSVCWSFDPTAVVPNLLLYVVQQCAGPKQEQIWSWSKLKECFPHVFVQPVVTTTSSNNTNAGELSATERRRLNRLRQATSTAGTSLIVTHSDQTQTIVPITD